MDLDQKNFGMSTFDFPGNDYWLAKKRYVFKASAKDPLPIEHGTSLRLYGVDYVTNQSGAKVIFKGHKQDREKWDGINVFGFSLNASRFDDKYKLKDAGLWVHWGVKMSLLGGRDLLKIDYGHKEFLDIKNHIGLNIHGVLDLGGGNDIIEAKASYQGIEVGDHGRLKTGQGDDVVIAKSSGAYAIAIDNLIEMGGGDDKIVGRSGLSSEESGGIFLNFGAKLSTGNGKDVIDGNGLYLRRRSRVSTGSGDDVIQAPLRSASASLKQRPVVTMGSGQDYLRLDSGEYVVKTLSSGNHLLKTQRGGNQYFVELEGVEFISGPSGQWLSLGEGSFVF